MLCCTGQHEDEDGGAEDAFTMIMIRTRRRKMKQRETYM
jgi:hypothetical protein